MPVPPAASARSRSFRTPLLHWIARLDLAGWQLFLQALLGLTAALFLALYATALRESGRYVAAAVFSAVSLLVAGLVAVKTVPYLARRTALERWMGKIEYEFTREGAVYLGVAAVIAIAALNTGNNLLFIVLACLLAGILASGFLSALILTGLEVDLSLPEHVFAGQPVAARIRLANRKHWCASFSLTLSSPKPRRRRRPEQNVKGRAILDQTVYVPYLPRRTSIDRSLEITFPLRGRYSQNGLRISTKFPFGFLRKARAIPLQREILVLPRIQPSAEFYNLLPLAGSEAESHLRGLGHDLYAIRDFQPTDPGRHVDWKATAKAQVMKIREFTREDERRVRLILDPTLAANTAEDLQNFEKAVEFCACLAWYFHETGAVLQFATQGFETPVWPAADLLYTILEKLALIEPVFGTGGADDGLMAGEGGSAEGLRILVCCRPRGSIPAGDASDTYVVFMDPA